MVHISDENMPRRFLLLEMTFQAKSLVAFVEQSLVDGAVGGMADHTPLTHRFVLINKRPSLRGMALEASFVSAQESKTAAFERLLHIGPATFDCDTDVRVVAIGTTHFPF